MGLQGIVGAAGHDALGEVGREEALEPAEALELSHLLGDAALERLVPLGELLTMARLLIVKPLLFQTRADSSLQQDRVERLVQIVLCAQLDAAHDALDLVERRDHQHGDSAKRRVGFQALEHGVAVEVGHHHVEEHQIDRARGQDLERRQPTRRAEDVVTLAREAASQHVAVFLVVVHDQDYWAARLELTRSRLSAGDLGRAIGGARAAAQELGEAGGGRADSFQIRQQRRGVCLRGPAVKIFALRTDALERRSKGVAGGREVRRPRLPACQHLVQQGQKLPGIGTERAEPRGELVLATVRELLEQELGVADDVVQRRA
jgi:hypothetical protein